MSSEHSIRTRILVILSETILPIRMYCMYVIYCVRVIDERKSQHGNSCQALFVRPWYVYCVSIILCASHWNGTKFLKRSYLFENPNFLQRKPLAYKTKSKHLQRVLVTSENNNYIDGSTRRDERRPSPHFRALFYSSNDVCKKCSCEICFGICARPI